MEVLEDLFTEENPTEMNLKKLADLVGVKDREMAESLKMDATAFSKNPYASSNPKVKQWHAVLNLIIRIFAESEPALTSGQIRTKMQQWIITPRPEFNSRTALEEIMRGRARKVKNLLEQML